MFLHIVDGHFLDFYYPFAPAVILSRFFMANIYIFLPSAFSLLTLLVFLKLPFVSHPE